MQCVRCLEDTASKIAEAPDGSKAWNLFFCERCHYSWRDDEPDYITDPAKRDPWGQMTDKGADFKGRMTLRESEYKSVRSKKK